jgi:uncharacterized membrane protein
METAGPQKQGMLRDWGYYSLWWAVVFAIVAIANGLQPLSALNHFWSAKLEQLVWGAWFGLVCAFLFTIVQNGLNKSRSKVRSWIFALVIWVAMKLGLTFVLGTL